MNLKALKKLATSSKVLLFAVFAAAITVALHYGLVGTEWYQDTIAMAFYALMGGYSVVETARAIAGNRIHLSDLVRVSADEPEDDKK